MKKIKRSLFLSLVAIVLLLSMGCSQSGHLSFPAEIDRMTFYEEGRSLTTATYTDAVKLEKIVNYLTSLDLAKTTDPNNAEQFFGGGWQIRIISNGEISGINIVGGNYLQAQDGSWWRITSEQLNELETVLKEQTSDE